MILDTLQNAATYRGLHPGIDRVLEVFGNYTAENYPTGRIDLDGDALYLNFNSYVTHDREGTSAEAHRQYIDVMFMVDGCETIWVKPTQQLRHITSEYDPSGDHLLAETDDDVVGIRLQTGSFVVLFPQDAHTPGCHAYGPAAVKKIVAKVRI